MFKIALLPIFKACDADRLNAPEVKVKVPEAEILKSDCNCRPPELFITKVLKLPPPEVLKVAPELPAKVTVLPFWVKAALFTLLTQEPRKDKSAPEVLLMVSAPFMVRVPAIALVEVGKVKGTPELIVTLLGNPVPAAPSVLAVHSLPTVVVTP